jgi:hypothetical protein
MIFQNETRPEEGIQKAKVICDGIAREIIHDAVLDASSRVRGHGWKIEVKERLLTCLESRRSGISDRS